MLTIDEYIKLSDDIVNEILSLPICQRYKNLQKEIENNPEMSYLVSQFEQAKIAYAEVEKYGSKYHPDYKNVSNKLIMTKTVLFEHSKIKELKKCEKEIQEIMDQITFSMKDAIKIQSTDKASSGCNGGCSH